MVDYFLCELIENHARQYEEYAEYCQSLSSPNLRDELAHLQAERDADCSESDVPPHLIRWYDDYKFNIINSELDRRAQRN